MKTGQKLVYTTFLALLIGSFVASNPLQVVVVDETQSNATEMASTEVAG